MARMFTDANTISRKMDKEREFRGFVQAFFNRKIEELKHETDRNEWSKFYVQYISVQKMYGNKVNELHAEMSEVLRDIDRSRKLRRDPNYLQDHYEYYNAHLHRYTEILREQANWLVGVAQLLDEGNILLSDSQLQTALSIPVKAWNRLYDTGRLPLIVRGYSA